ncbi:MAG: hypothetical protein ACLSH0_10075 [Mediterraneibacter faecis]
MYGVQRRRSGIGSEKLSQCISCQINCVTPISPITREYLLEKARSIINIQIRWMEKCIYSRNGSCCTLKRQLTLDGLTGIGGDLLEILVRRAS